jgi:hypothetical protein
MAGNGADQGQSQVNPQHQYNPAQQAAPSTAAFVPPPPAAVSLQTSPLLAAGMFGMIVVATGTLGANLHKVGEGDMSLTEALSHSLYKGAAGGIAAAAATAASASLTRGGALGLAVTVAAATGVSYLLNTP